MVGGSVRPSVCLSHRPTAVTAAGGFAAERPMIDSRGRRAAGAGAQQRMRVASC